MLKVYEGAWRGSEMVLGGLLSALDLLDGSEAEALRLLVPPRRGQQTGKGHRPDRDGRTLVRVVGRRAGTASRRNSAARNGPYGWAVRTAPPGCPVRKGCARRSRRGRRARCSAAAGNGSRFEIERRARHPLPDRGPGPLQVLPHRSRHGFVAVGGESAQQLSDLQPVRAGRRERPAPGAHRVVGEVRRRPSRQLIPSPFPTGPLTGLR